MQANEFEKNVQKAMESFALLPADEVWDKVSQRIAQKQKKRRMIFWLLPCGLLVCGLLAWWFGMSGGDLSVKGNKFSVQRNADQQASGHSLQKIEESKSLPHKITVSHGRDGATVSTSAVINNQPKDFTVTKKLLKHLADKNEPAGIGENISYSHLLPGNGINKKAKDPVKAESIYTDTLQQSLSKINIVKLPESVTDTLSALKAAVSAKDKLPASENKRDKKPADSTVKLSTVLQKKTTHNKWSVGFNMYAGLSDNIIYSPKSNLSAAELSTIPILTAAQDVNTPALQYTLSFSFGMGGFVYRHISERFRLSAGIDYHLYQSSSKTGDRVNGSFSFYDSVLNHQVNGSGYYKPGYAAQFTNRYHLLEFPLLISYNLRKNPQRPVLFAVGISPGLIMGSSALFYNPSKGILYADNEQFQRFQLSAQAGIVCTIKSVKGYRIEAGPVFQYQFSNLVKPQVNTRQHLLFTGIKATYILP